MRVAVTGLGVVSPLGRGSDNLLRALLSGRTSICEDPRLIAAGFRHVRVAAVDRKLVEPVPGDSLACSYALAACRDAIAEAKLDAFEGAGLYINMVHAGLTGIDAELADKAQWQLDDPATIVGDSQAARAATLAHLLGLRGDVQVVIGTCAGNLALDMALLRLRAGAAPIALAVGMETAAFAAYAGFHQTRALADVCRPFDVARAGIVMGEGAACLVLEPLQHARARGAQVLAELVAVGCSNDAHDLVAPDNDGRGAEAAMRAALRHAGLAATDIDYVSAHGTGTPLNDRAEAHAIARVFGLPSPFVSSIKGALGHTMAAASALEAAVTVQTLASQSAPPTQGLQQRDPVLPEINLDTPPKTLRTALSNSFGLGGNNAVAIFATPGLGSPMVRRRRAFVQSCATLMAPTLDLDFASLLGRPLRHVDRSALLVAAAARAWPDWPTRADSAGIVLGCAHPSFHAAHAVAERLRDGGHERINPAVVPHAVGNSAASWFAIRRAIRGYSATLATSDCAGLDAIVLAADQVALDLEDALAGGVAAAHADLWTALRTHGRRRLEEGAALVRLTPQPGGALAEVGAHASCFEPAQPLRAFQRACAQLLGGASNVPLFAHLPAPLRSLSGCEPAAMTCADSLAASGALVAVLAAQHCADQQQTVCAAVAAPEGFATALLLHPIGRGG